MSTISTGIISSDLDGVAGNLALRTSATDRLTINPAGTVTVAGTYTTGDISTATYNGYVPVNRAGDTVTGTITTNSVTVFQVNGNTVYYAGNYNSIINRGNPGAASTLLLDRFDQVHVYSADGVSSIALSTTMVPNSIYSVHYTTNASAANMDITISPNFTLYAGQFQGFYYGSPQDTAGNPTIFNQPGQPNFYFDHYGGGLGTEPTGTITLFNFTEKKHALYHGGDTQSHCYGTSRWNNNSTVWTNVGTLAGNSSMNIRVHIRRVG